MMWSAGSSVSRQGYADATDVTRPVGDSGSSRLAGSATSMGRGAVPDPGKGMANRCFCRRI